MEKLEQIAETIRAEFDARTAARDNALAQARMLTPSERLASRASRLNLPRSAWEEIP